MYATEVGAKLLILAVFWLVLASPFLAVAFFSARAMRRRRVTSRFAILSFALLAAVLLAPVPTPIITFFVPNGFALLDGDYYARLFSGDKFFGQLWPWVITSVILTSAVTMLLSLRYITAPAKANVSSGHADA
jgi:hypothetical protein